MNHPEVAPNPRSSTIIALLVFPIAFALGLGLALAFGCAAAAAGSWVAGHELLALDCWRGEDFALGAKLGGGLALVVAAWVVIELWPTREHPDPWWSRSAGVGLGCGLVAVLGWMVSRGVDLFGFWAPLESAGLVFSWSCWLLGVALLTVALAAATAHAAWDLMGRRPVFGLFGLLVASFGVWVALTPAPELPHPSLLRLRRAAVQTAAEIGPWASDRMGRAERASGAAGSLPGLLQFTRASMLWGVAERVPVPAARRRSPSPVAPRRPARPPTPAPPLQGR